MPWLIFKLRVDVGDNEIQICIYAIVIESLSASKNKE